MSARILNVLIGTWLFLSAFAWPHGPMQKASAVVCGILTMLSALASIYYPRVRYLTAVLAVALFVASLSTAGRYDVTFWHNAVVAIGIFVVALFDRGTPRERHRLRTEGDELSSPISGPPQQPRQSRI
jgi:hypothetical protein